MSLRSRAEQAKCTPVEVEAAVLNDLGWGYRRIAAHQGVSMTTVRDRIAKATQKLAAAQRARP